MQFTKDPEEQIVFYCAVCEEAFWSRRDGTGFDQAPCPKCGDLSNTPEFHIGEAARSASNHVNMWVWILGGVGMAFSSGLLWAVLRSFF